VRTIRACAAMVAGSLAIAAPAAAATAPNAAATPAPKPKPWATVNVCDTKAHPDQFGVRGSMPGIGTQRTHLWMRIQAQYQLGDGTWRDLKSTGDSGWLDAGKTTLRRRQAGQTFTITPPSGGAAAYVLRARVAFEWRRGSRVLKHATAYTTAGHRDAQDGDPAGYSAATCAIT
jgi:hypothetical protein